MGISFKSAAHPRPIQIWVPPSPVIVPDFIQKALWNFKFGTIIILFPQVTEEYQPPKTKFTGESTFCSHFKGEKAPPAKSCRPPRRPHTSSGKSMYFETTYRTSFRRPVSCPMIEMLDLDGAAPDSEAEEKITARPQSADKWLMVHPV